MMKMLLNFFACVGVAATTWLVIHSLIPFSKPDDNAIKNLQFDLVDPNEAPKALRDQVEKGYRLVLQTHTLLPEYSGDRLDCSSCHFAGGITTGGVNGGISLVGVAEKYTKETLPIRVNKCFIDSMNGKPLPLESNDMLAIIAYLNWISKGYQGISPWLGVKPLKSTHVPDATKGKQLYQLLCMDCHGKDGDGGNNLPGHAGKSIPPVFGKNSYNTSAGMNNLQVFASFIYHNMPLGDPSLTAPDALDIAAYIQEQPRPIKKD